MKLMLPSFQLSKIIQIRDVISVSYKLMNLIWRTDKGLLLLMFGSILLPAITPFATAYSFKLIIDQVAHYLTTSTINLNYLYSLFAVVVFVQLIQRFAFTIQDYTIKVFYIKLPIEVNQIVLNKIATLDMQYFEDSNFHDALLKVRENYTWRPQRLSHVILMCAQSFLQVLIALAVLVTLNPWLAVLITVVAIPDLINQVLFSKFAWNVWDHKTPQRRKFGYNQSLLQNQQSIKEIKIFGMKSKFLTEVYKTQIDFFNDNKKIANNQLKVNSIFNLFDVLVSFGILAYVVLQAVNKKITIGDISFYQSAVSNFNNGVSGLFRNMSQIFEHTQYMKSVFDVLELKPIVVEHKNPIKVDFTKTPTIEFKNVSFRYPGTKKYVFKDFNLIIEPGEKVAFVGENGAGKTTMIKLLSRFYDVTEGEILIDNINIKDLELESWYKAVGVLFQDFIRYEYPVKDNIFFGRVWEKENLEAIIDASRASGAHEMVKQFESEYNQMLGKTFEGGIDLSGGQWQKIALARAFFRNAPILVLDEPTSAIDAKAESEIFERVEKLSKDKTVIIISHRFSTVRNADKIYVVDKGKIKESGTHQELMKESGTYAKLFNLQAKGYQ